MVVVARVVEVSAGVDLILRVGVVVDPDRLVGVDRYDVSIEEVVLTSELTRDRLTDHLATIVDISGVLRDHHRFLDSFAGAHILL